ncbi:MAG: glutamate-cysteine ligase family protein [Peptoniphilaceae bacterium]|nr:glutamate-cysteine ligase family protein [Peptoniphilaceae bacterium]MDY6018337.1 glutamate-cysteine ligase family protein [Anaerococcus sp.]
MTYEEKLEKVIEYIKKGEKPEEEYKLGIEMEHFTIDKDSLKSLDYYGDMGVGDTLNRLKNKGFEVETEHDGYILALKKDEYNITIEPAGQLEISINGKKNIGQIKEAYDNIMKQIIPIYFEKNQYLVALGYHPVSKIDDLKIIPKDRYRYMERYFKEFGGPMALNMMKGTSSVQTSIDFSSEEDFKRKYFLANALSVFLYTAFDNAYIFEGEAYKERNLRQRIWEKCDPMRTGAYDFAFDKDLSYKKYADRILNTDIIFINQGGKDVYMGATKFKDIMDTDNSYQMIFHALSIVFPDVRLKSYIEIRMPDGAPAPFNFAFVGFIKGLFYDTKNLNYLESVFSDMTYEDYKNLRDDSYKYGLDAKYKDKKIVDWMIEFIYKAEEGLKDEKDYLYPLKELMLVKQTLRDKFELLYKQDKKTAIERFSVSYYLDKEN